jgi:hypothetical protein
MVISFGAKRVPIVEEIPERGSSVTCFHSYFDVVKVAIRKHLQSVRHMIASLRSQARFYLAAIITG